MSQWINKQFKNNATTPMIVSIAAKAEGSAFGAVQPNDRVIDILATGGVVPDNDTARAEAQRMHKWIRDTFIGNTAAFLHAHDGTVPDAIRVSARDLKPEVHVVNAIDIVNAISPEAAEKIARHVQREITRSSERENVGHEGFTIAPHPGTYWQDRERTDRYFVVTQKSECEGHTHIRMTRVDNMRGGVYDYPYENAEQWGKMFAMVSGSSVPNNPYAHNSATLYFDQGKVRVLYDGITMVEAADLTDEQIESLVKEHGAQYPELRRFLTEQRQFGQPGRKIEMPAALGAGYSKRAPYKDIDPATGLAFLRPIPLAGVPEPRPELMRSFLHYRGQLREALRSKPPTDIPQYMREFIQSVPMDGAELPPREGEKYFSVFSDSVYIVVDVRRKHESTDYYVTMDRADGHRTKFTYRNHAEWLATWRPADDEGKARTTVPVDVELPRAQKLTFKLDTTQAQDMMRRLSESVREAAEETRRYFAVQEDSAILDLVRIGDELHKRLPGWNKDVAHWERPLTESDLMIRALRTMARQRDNTAESLRNVSKENEALKEQAKMTSVLLDVRNKGLAALDKEVDALKKERGGSWGPDRIATEQKRMFDMLQEYCRLFKFIFGVQRLRIHASAFGARSLHAISLEQYVSFMKDCRTHAEKVLGDQFEVG